MDIESIKNILDYSIIAILGFMSFLTVWIWIERLIFYKKVNIKDYIHKEELEIDITNNIGVISTIASNAPYIGLLGTVIGIIITFYEMGINGDLAVTNIMTSLALALKATAMGLIVAIPAIIFYNHLVRKIEVILAKWNIANEN